MVSNRLTLRVMTPEQTLLQEEGLTRIRVQLADGGSIGIRPRHHPLLAATESGAVEYGIEKYDRSLGVRAGILEIEHPLITIYTSGLIEGHPQFDSRESELELSRLSNTLLEIGVSKGTARTG
jgi:F0F1-type ATP synthase epsilon subunit